MSKFLKSPRQNLKPAFQAALIVSVSIEIVVPNQLRINVSVGDFGLKPILLALHFKPLKKLMRSAHVAY